MSALVVTALLGYLLGSLPFGYLVARAKGVNIFEVGSKNPGATNVRRVLGSGAGNLVLALDAAKGAAAVALAFGHLTWSAGGMPSSIWFEYSTDMADSTRPLIALVAAMLGHSFSCFTRFRGGKSVATGAGGFALVFPLGIGVALAVFGVTLLVSRYVSLASMLAASSLPFAAFSFKKSPALIVVSAAVAAFVIYRHRGNLARLRAGTESKIGRKTPAALKS